MRHTVELGGGRQVVLMDSISHVEPTDEGAVIVSASHGGISAGEVALATRPRLVTFNDAGLGKDDAGIAGVRILDKAGIAACACDSYSARIGHADDCWEHGVISATNDPASAMGIRTGMTIQDAVSAAFDSEGQ